MAKASKSVESVGGKAEPKKPKHRSPNYPVVNLKKAVELAKSLGDKYGTHQVHVPLVHKLWCYEEGSNAGNRCIAALEAYGLIEGTGEGEGRKIALSKAGVRVVGNAPDRLELLRHAAIGPKIHKEILKHYGDAGLPNDELLERYLVWDRPEGQRFNPDFVKGFIKRFRDTLEYSGLASGGANEKNDGTPLASQAKVGDYVQWTSQGVEQFPVPQQVAGIAEGGEFAFIEGSETGLPMSELTVVDPPSGANANLRAPAAMLGQSETGGAGLVTGGVKLNSPPLNPFYKPPVDPPRDDLDDEKTNLDEGPVVLRWPKKLSEASVDEFEYWIEGVVRRARRKAGMDPTTKKPAEPSK